MATLLVTPIQALDTPELEVYSTLQRVVEHERAGIFVATNVKVVQRLLASRFEVLSALLTESWLEKLEVSLKARPEKAIPVYVGEKPPLEKIAGYHLHQGAVGVRCVAAHLSPDATKLSGADLSGNTCIFFGAESPGLSDAVISACDDVVKIAMQSHMNSLNVAAATAVFLYEATRQRGNM